MNILSIMISSSTIIITVLILVLMAIIGYYADKTIYSKEYKEKQERKKAKKLNLANARINDLVGEKKELNNQNEQLNNENVEQKEISQVEVNSGLVQQEPLTSNSNENNNLSFDSTEPAKSELEFDNTTENSFSTELAFDKPATEENLESNIAPSQEVMVNNSEESTTNESLIFNNQVSEQNNEASLLEENNENTELSFDSPIPNFEQTNDGLQFDQQIEDNNESTSEMLFNNPMSTSVTEEPTSEFTQENDTPSDLINFSQESSPVNEFDINQASNTTIDLETKDLVDKVENNYQNVNEPSVSSMEMSDQQAKEDFQMDEDLENMLKADILQSIKTIEEETMHSEDNNSFSVPTQSSNATSSTNLSLDDDLGINELPKLKTDKEVSKSDDLAVDDIFKI